MKYKSIVVTLTCLLVIAACNKNQPFAGPKLAKVIDFRANTATYYNYNDDGTIATIKGIGDTTFSYMGDTVMETIYGSNGTPSGGYLFVKNSSGWADTAVGTGALQLYSYSFTYDGYDMLTQQYTYLAQGSVRNLIQGYTFTNSGKNIYELITTNYANNGSKTYDYFTFFSSNSNSTGVQDQGKYFLGASATSPTASDINLNNNLDTVYTITYRYAYDGSGRIDTMVAYKKLWRALTGTQVDSMAFEYYN